MKKNQKPKVDISGMTDKHVQTLWQTLYDILYERGELGDKQIIVTGVRKK